MWISKRAVVLFFQRHVSVTLSCPYHCFSEWCSVKVFNRDAYFLEVSSTVLASAVKCDWMYHLYLRLFKNVDVFTLSPFKDTRNISLSLVTVTALASKFLNTSNTFQKSALFSFSGIKCCVACIGHTWYHIHSKHVETVYFCLLFVHWTHWTVDVPGIFFLSRFEKISIRKSARWIRISS